jgi:chloride channel 7
MQAQFWAPAAAAAGVSLVMAYLNGVAIPDLLSLRTLVAKFVGTCCSVAANMTLGPEAPMVHLGACAAHVTTHAACGASQHPCMHACMHV